MNVLKILTATQKPFRGHRISSPKMEAAGSFETLVMFYQTTRHHIQNGSYLHNKISYYTQCLICVCCLAVLYQHDEIMNNTVKK
jgi:hypothetical protein